MLSTVSAIEEQMLCCLGLSTQKCSQKTLIRNRDFLHYNHLSGIVAEFLAPHFPGLPPCLCFFWWILLLSFICEETQPPLSFFFGEFLVHTPANSLKEPETPRHTLCETSKRRLSPLLLVLSISHNCGRKHHQAFDLWNYVGIKTKFP